jgi:hypothetical protein
MAVSKVSRPRTVPREFIVVVGGPSNTFNGYLGFDAAGNAILPKKPRTLDDLKTYLPPPPGQPNPTGIATHDLYWGNFVDPVHRIFSLGIAKPEPGDMVTVAIMLKLYQKRNLTDWDASPHNPNNRFSPWVRGKSPYDPSVLLGLQGTNKPAQRPTLQRKGPPPGAQPVSDTRIDHEILMRTTDEGTGLIVKRPARPTHYIDLIHDIPRRCVTGNMLLDDKKIVLPRVLVKIIFIREFGELLGYLATGNWIGDRAKHLLDTVDEEDMANAGINEDTTFDFHVRGSAPQFALKFWKDVPRVRRKHVKIHRLDYIGHSDKDAWFLSYGTKNDKGVEPVSEIVADSFTLTDETFAFGDKPHFTPDAVCQMWGCNLGQPGGMAEGVSKLIPEVVASNIETTFEQIADSDTALPEPMAGGQFVTFRKPP